MEVESNRAQTLIETLRVSAASQNDAGLNFGADLDEGCLRKPLGSRFNMTSPSPLLFDTYYHIYDRGMNGGNSFVAERNCDLFRKLYDTPVSPVARGETIFM